MNTTEFDVLTNESVTEINVLDELESLTDVQLAMVGGGQGLFTFD